MRAMRALLGIVAGSALITGMVAPAATAQVPPIGLPDVPVDLPVDVPLDGLPALDGLPDLDVLDLAALELLGPILECASTDDLAAEADVAVAVLLCVISVAADLLGDLLGSVPVPDVPS